MAGIAAVARLTRVEHSIMLVIAVIAAELISAKSLSLHLPSIPVLVLSLVVPIFISMSSFAINDYFDVEADRLNKRMDRPIVAGQITMRGALTIALVTLAIGIAASALINLYAFAIALIFGALAMLYSYRMKDILILGNMYIAFSMAIPFIFGDFVVTKRLLPSIVIIFLIIFLSGLAREIHGMIRDYRGDSKARNTRNLLRYIKRKPASEIAFILYLEAVVLSVYLFFFQWPFLYNVVYIVPIALVDAALLYVSLVYSFRSMNARSYGLTRNISLAAMAVALLAFLASAIVHVAV